MKFIFYCFFILLLFFTSFLLIPASAATKEKKPKGKWAKAASSSGKSHRDKSSAPASASSISSPSSTSLGSEGIGGSLWSTSGRRTGSLFCRVGIGFHLQIHPDGKVNGSHEANHLSILEIFAVSQGIVGIRGVFSNTFLTMSKKGKLHATMMQCVINTLHYIFYTTTSVGHQKPRFTDECKFIERYQENSYNTYSSATYRTEKTGRRWYVALNKRGKAKRGCSPRVRPQHISTHFLPRIKHSEPQEMSFSVTSPEKKKKTVSPAKPKTVLLPPKKNSSPVRYRLKFRFG